MSEPRLYDVFALIRLPNGDHEWLVIRRGYMLGYAQERGADAGRKGFWDERPGDVWIFYPPHAVLAVRLEPAKEPPPEEVAA